MSQTAKPPVGAGGVSFIGALLSIAITALGVVAVRDALIAWNFVDGDPWVSPVISGELTIEVGTWLLVLAIVVALVGLYLLSSSLRPRPKRAVALESETSVFVPTRGLSAIAINAAEDVDGVMSASATSSRNKVRVRATTTNATSQLKDQVRTAVEERFTSLSSKPKVVVSVKQKGAEE